MKEKIGNRNSQASNAQKAYIKDLLRQLEYLEEDYNFDKLTIGSASDLIGKLKAERDDLNHHLKRQGVNGVC